MTNETSGGPTDEVKPLLTEEEIEARTVERTPTQRLDANGDPLEPPPGHGGRPQE